MSISVMVLDDEFIILDGMSSFPWERYDCQLVATAQNGQEALEKMEEFQPDLVFTDIRMPKMDGISFAAEA
ncbi:MAG TPA: response regulator, partial [Candidatus Mediterraneibacter norfolkensis]|nr:response regulator [Candidatus Mediterraneibacter norfolkensis]